jgi:hypothetical protein
VLTIEAGTTVEFSNEPFKASNPQPLASLVIEPGAKIIADGTQRKPIKFLAEDGFGTFGLLGIFSHDRTDAASPAWFLADGTNVPFGGPTSNTASSGVLRYVIIGGGSGAQIAGGALILGGVGSQTQIDHVYITNGYDDGIDVNGGSVNLRYIRVDGVLDDGIDLSNGYTGTVSNFEVSRTFAGSGIESNDPITIKDGTISRSLVDDDDEEAFLRVTFGSKSNVVFTVDNVAFSHHQAIQPDASATSTGTNSKITFINPAGTDIIATTDGATGSAPAATGWSFPESQEWW